MGFFFEIVHSKISKLLNVNMPNNIHKIKLNVSTVLDFSQNFGAADEMARFM